MARTAADDTTYFDDVRATAFLTLRKTMLGLRDKEIAEKIEMDRGSFSQAAAGRDKKGFSAKRFDALKQLMGAEIARLKSQASADASLVPKVEGAEKAYDEVFGSREIKKEELVYFEPGRLFLPTARNYITRTFDDSIERTLFSTSQSVAVYGGPGSGKSSYLLRLAEAAKQAGLRCRYADLRPQLPGNFEAGGESQLSVGDLANLILREMTKDPRIHIREKEIKNADARYAGILIHDLILEVFARPEFRDSIFILDGYNECIYHAQDDETVGAVTTALLGHRLGSGRSKIVLPDDGVSFATDIVSDYVTRSEEIRTAAVGYYDIDRLAKSVFDNSEISIDPVSGDRLLDAFGGCIFLHHTAFDLVRRQAETEKLSVNSRILLDALPEAMETVLEKLSSTNIENEPDRVYRQLARFGQKVTFLLSRIAATQKRYDPMSDKAAMLRAIEQPRARIGDITRNYMVLRSLKWAGFCNDVGVIPRFVKAAAGAAAPVAPKRSERPGAAP